MISEKELQIAARSCEKAILAGLPKPEDCEAAFSKSFERRMDAMCRRAAHPIRCRLKKCAACFLLILLLGGGCILAFSGGARAAFLGWVREVYETFFAYRYVGDVQEPLDGTVYRPTWVPDGYEIVSETAGHIDDAVTYQNADGALAAFLYVTAYKSAELRIDREDVEARRVFVGECPADLYLDPEDGKGNVLIWFDEGSGLFFSIWATFSEDEMIKMAESVAAQK